METAATCFMALDHIDQRRDAAWVRLQEQQRRQAQARVTCAALATARNTTISTADSLRRMAACQGGRLTEADRLGERRRKQLASIRCGSSALEHCATAAQENYTVGRRLTHVRSVRWKDAICDAVTGAGTGVAWTSPPVGGSTGWATFPLHFAVAPSLDGGAGTGTGAAKAVPASTAGSGCASAAVVASMTR